MSTPQQEKTTAPATTAPAPAVDGSTALNSKRRKLLYGILMGSLAVHVFALAVFGSIKLVQYLTKEETVFEAPPPSKTYEPRKVELKVKVQKRNAYTRASQNELALQLYNMGFFAPQQAAPALVCLDMMDFEGKDELMQKISVNGDLFQQLQAMAMMAMGLAQRYEPQNAAMVAQLAPSLGIQIPTAAAAEMPAEMPGEEENGITKKAREKSNATTEVNS